jgi:cytochrome c
MNIRDTGAGPAAHPSQQRVTGWSTLLTIAVLTLLAAVVIGLAAAQDTEAEELPKGVGPIESIELDDELDLELAALGEETFELLCSACHKVDERYVGPAILGVTERRAPEWIMNMILAPEIMVWEDETAYDLMAEYMVAMPNQGLDEDQARAILEYFRVLDDEAAE